jgi:Raf kinase inhibitor-like YbhB/YbcL family protein
MPPTRRIDGRGGKVQWWIAAAVLAGIVVVILISLPARDTHIPPQPAPPADDTAVGSQPGAGQGQGSQMGGFTLKSSAFENGAPIPAEYTADGGNTNPPLSISGLPESTVTMALIVDDPDAPAGTWVHWVMWNIPVNALEIASGAVPAGAVQGKNSGGKQFYSGPAPPSGKHRYFFKLYALDEVLQLNAAASKRELEHAMEGHIIAQATLIGTYIHAK